MGIGWERLIRNVIGRRSRGKSMVATGGTTLNSCIDSLNSAHPPLDKSPLEVGFRNTIESLYRHHLNRLDGLEPISFVLPFHSRKQEKDRWRQVWTIRRWWGWGTPNFASSCHNTIAPKHGALSWWSVQFFAMLWTVPTKRPVSSLIRAMLSESKTFFPLVTRASVQAVFGRSTSLSAFLKYFVSLKISSAT